MWADNETDIDLLGFDYLVDSLELVLTDETLYPITVGVLGHWGSGKTSLMGMAEDQLAASDEYLCVAFSPWRFESYDDVKTALMATVLTAIQERLDKQAHAARAAGDEVDEEKLARLRARMGRLWKRVKRFAPLATPALGLGVGAGASALGIPSEVAQMATGIAQQAVAGSGSDVEQQGDESPPTGEVAPEYTSAAEFRADFEDLVDEIDGLTAVIVFVDDLDRCLPPTILQTFEAIRLFLHVPKTAYVLAAHPSIVEAAVAHRYEGNREGDADLGRDYLEKIIQLPITVPALSESEVETYINLLFAQRHLEEDDFEQLREAAQKHRESNQLDVAMNYGIASSALGRDIDPELQAQFALAASIGPTLARGLRGNPRQVKRFLNAMTLRLRTAEKRKVDLETAVLAKLMVLEYLHREEFQRLFEWQANQDGTPAELAGLEAIVLNAADPTSVADGAREWAENSSIQAWAEVEPRLAGIDLRPYYFFSRQGLSPVASAARLSGEQQALVAALRSTAAAKRKGAVEATVALDPIARSPVYAALLTVAVREPGTPAIRSALDIAIKVPDVVPAFARALREIPPRSVPQSLPLQIATGFKRNFPGEIEAVLATWQTSAVAGLQTAANRALRRT
jgi:hypothetical protein